MLRYVLFLATVLGSVTAFAQDESHIDSLEADLAAREANDTLRVHTLINLWRATSNNDLQRAEAYSRRIIAESRAMDYGVGEATGYQRLGIIQDFLAQKDSALANYAKAIAIYQARKMGRLEGIMLFNTAIIHQENGSYDTARHYLRLADERFASGDNPVERSAVNKLTAVIERQLGHPDQALVHARLAYDLARSAGDSSRMADAEQEIAFGYQALDDFRTAADFFRRCADYYRRMEEGAEGYNHHSDADLDGNDEARRRGYVAVPLGQLKVYDPSTGDIDVVADGLAYDKGYYEKFFGKEHPAKTRQKYYRRIQHGQVTGGGTAARTAAQEKRNLLRYAQSIARAAGPPEEPARPRPGVMNQLKGYVRRVFWR